MLVTIFFQEAGIGGIPLHSFIVISVTDEPNIYGIKCNVHYSLSESIVACSQMEYLNRYVDDKQLRRHWWHAEVAG